MSAPTARCSRTKVQNDFGCLVQEINSSLVPETIEWCHVLSSRAYSRGQGYCSGWGGVGPGVLVVRRGPGFPDTPTCLGQGQEALYILCSPLLGSPSVSPVACLVGDLGKTDPSLCPFLSMHFPLVGLSLEGKGWFPWDLSTLCFSFVLTCYQ
jgi:hypothetical protein